MGRNKENQSLHNSRELLRKKNHLEEEDVSVEKLSKKNKNNSPKKNKLTLNPNQMKTKNNLNNPKYLIIEHAPVGPETKLKKFSKVNSPILMDKNNPLNKAIKKKLIRKTIPHASSQRLNLLPEAFLKKEAVQKKSLKRLSKFNRPKVNNNKAKKVKITKTFHFSHILPSKKTIAKAELNAKFNIKLWLCKININKDKRLINNPYKNGKLPSRPDN